MDRTIIIGDVHGCIDEFMDLIRTVNPTKRDHVIFAGDLVDKGPHSAKVVKKARRLKNQCEVTLVMGNHEEKHQRFRKHLAKGTGKEKNMKNYEELASITAKLSSRDIDFLNSAKLYCKIPEYDSIVVHAGISPNILYLPSHEDLKNMSKKKRKHFEQMLRVRYVNPNGYMVHLGHEQDEDKYWADVYDGRFGKVFYGHQPYYVPDPVVSKHAIGLDLGCVFGNVLCAAILSSDAIDYVKIPARKKYAKKMGEE